MTLILQNHINYLVGRGSDIFLFIWGKNGVGHAIPGDGAERVEGVAVNPIRDCQRIGWAVEETLATGNAVLGIGNYRLVRVLVKPEHVHGTDIHTALATHAAL